MSRFDYVKYDNASINKQNIFKEQMLNLEDDIHEFLTPSREQSLALTALEEAYMWLGKAIKNDQIKLSGIIDLQEERSNS